jgi:hypothetical protein
MAVANEATEVSSPVTLSLMIGHRFHLNTISGFGFVHGLPNIQIVKSENDCRIIEM